jgi:hypothetical protein
MPAGTFVGLITQDDVVGQLVEALRYNPEGRGFDIQWGNWDFK